MKEKVQQLAEGGRRARLQHSSPVPPDEGLAYREAAPPQTLRAWAGLGAEHGCVRASDSLGAAATGFHPVYGSQAMVGKDHWQGRYPPLEAPRPDTSRVCREET